VLRASVVKSRFEIEIEDEIEIDGGRALSEPYRGLFLGFPLCGLSSPPSADSA